MAKGMLRSIAVVAVIFTCVVAALLEPSRSGATFASNQVTHNVQFDQRGVSGTVAARVLNQLARKTAGKHARATTGVHFILNWLPNVEFAGLWMATKLGMWSKAGIDMSFTGWSPAVHPETDVAARGGNTFGFQSGAAIAIARAQKVPIKALYTDTQRSVFGLTVLAKSNIHKITDLRGKKVGYQGHEIYVPQTMLAYAGLKPSDWSPVQVGFDIVQLTAGRVDAYLTFLINEPIALKLNGVPTRSFAAAKYGFNFYDDVMFTTDSLIAKNPALVRKVTRIVAQGFQYAHSHPVASAQFTVSKYFPASSSGNTDVFGKPIKGNENLRQQTQELQAFSTFSRDSKGAFSGLMTQSTWQASIDTLFKYGLIKSKPSASSVFTNQFNPFK